MAYKAYKIFRLRKATTSKPKRRKRGRKSQGVVLYSYANKNILMSG